VTTNRRDFLKTSAVASGALGLGLAPSLAGAAPVAPAPTSAPEYAGEYAHVERAPKPLRILILGGTGFTGPWQVAYAKARGHKITTFNRGRRKVDGFDFTGVEQLVGDRGVFDPKKPDVKPVGDYSALKGREWDVVIDVPTTLPRWAREAAAAVKGRAKHYIHVSTISVYAANDTPGADETAAVATTDTPDKEDGGNALYGALKALSEKEVQKAFPGRATIVRPGLIVGPGDTTDRFTYWPVRIRRGGEVLAPGSPMDPVQIIDARDLAEFIIRCAENETYGVFNATGPAGVLTMAEMLGGIRSVVTNPVKLTFADTPFLQEQRVRPWGDMPVWIPPIGETAGFTSRSIAKAIAAGLTFRPLADTTRDTLAYYDKQPAERQAQLRAGMPEAREKEVLAAWHARAKQG
jgi:2'-hydroxyisoflavone reductase